MASNTTWRSSPPLRSNPSIQLPNAPWPGTRILSALEIVCASDVTWACAPAASNAFCTLRRFPLPVSTMATRGRAEADDDVEAGVEVELTLVADLCRQCTLCRGHTL